MNNNNNNKNIFIYIDRGYPVLVVANKHKGLWVSCCCPAVVKCVDSADS